MDSNFDENKNLSNDVNFDSKNIVRHDNKELFTRVEGAETRAKKAAEERACVERAKRRFVKRAENDTKRRARKIASAQRRAHLKAVLWEGKNKRRTIIISVIILVAALVYPAYLGGSALISTVVSEVDKAKEAEEVKVFYENPENYANLVLSELTTKYKEDGFDAGEEYFNDAYSKAEDNELRGELCIAHARAIVNVFNNEKIDLAIEIALEADELRQNDRTALLLVELYSRKGDNYKSQEYESLYNKRADNSEKGEG